MSTADAKSGLGTEGTCASTGGYPRSRSGAQIFASDRFHRGEPGSPDVSRPKFTSQKRTQKRTKAFSFLLLPAIVDGVAPNAADLPPHHIPGVTGGSRDADRVRGSFV